MKLTFGKYRGKTIEDLLCADKIGYIVWLAENVKSVYIEPKIYRSCKEDLIRNKLAHEASMESNHQDWGCRD